MRSTTMLDRSVCIALLTLLGQRTLIMHGLQRLMGCIVSMMHCECRSFRLQVDSPTLRLIRLHDLSRFAYTSKVVKLRFKFDKYQVDRNQVP